MLIEVANGVYILLLHLVFYLTKPQTTFLVFHRAMQTRP